MLLSQKDSNVLKGVAIICIVFHNIVHVLSAVKENEFSFSAAHLERFLSDFSQYPLIIFLSYFGWMGVSVFVFISGYGLSAKYSNARIKPFQWIGCH